ncbi:MAG: GIY-YIG nuclease family protein [Byssovorax sp.]
MLATIIHDQFKTDERKPLAEAIDDLCTPDGTGEWASGGVYSFWAPDTHELLYIGLAVDLAQRFRQHTGLVGAPASGCKLEKIDAYFQTKQLLGYSALVQSPMNQEMCWRALEKYGDDPPDEVAEACNAAPGPGAHAINFTEGLLIEAYRKKYNQLPPWNDRAGNKLGAERANRQHTYIIDILTESAADVMEARRPIRQLAENYTWMHFENFLHGVRQFAAATGASFSSIWAQFPDELGMRDRIRGDGYLTEAEVDLFEAAERKWRQDNPEQ